MMISKKFRNYYGEMLTSLLSIVFLTAFTSATAQDFTLLHDFTNSINSRDYYGSPIYGGSLDGSTPKGGLLLSNGTIYGVTAGGYVNAANQESGLIFSVKSDGSGYNIVHNFEPIPAHSVNDNYGGHYYISNGTNNDGANPQGGLIQSGNILYGAASSGGPNQVGTIYSVSTDGSGFTTLYAFKNNSDGGTPNGGLLLSGNQLYGTASGGGSNGYGTVYSINTNGSGFTTLHTFTGYNDGSTPNGWMALSGNTLYGATYSSGIGGGGTIFSVNVNGTGFKTLYSFYGGNDGSGPQGGVSIVGDTLYGVAAGGGVNGYGTIYSIKTNGTKFTALYSFGKTIPYQSGLNTYYTNSDGCIPNGGVIVSGSTLYGTAGLGGTFGYGALFSINTNGSGFTNLFSFAGSAGVQPQGGLFLSGSSLYGVATLGGLGYDNRYYNNQKPSGTLFSLNLSGSSTPLSDLSFEATLAATPNFFNSLASNTSFLTALAGQITQSSNNYGISAQGIPGPQGLTGATGPQGPIGPQGQTGVFDPTVLTNTAFLNGLASNSTFLLALSNKISITSNNLGIATKGDIASINTATTGVSNTLTTLLGSQGSSLSNALSNTLVTLSGVSNALSSNSLGISNVLASSIASQGSSLSNALSGASNALAGAINSNTLSLSNVLSASIATQTAGVSNSLSTSLSTQGAILSNAVSNAIVTIGSVSNSLASNSLSLSNALTTSIASQGSSFSNALSGASNALAGAISSQGSSLSNAISNTVLSLNSVSNALNAQITTQTTGVSNALAASLANQSDILSNALSNSIALVRTQTAGVSNVLAGAIATSSSLSSSQITAVSNALSVALQNNSQSITTALSNAIAQLSAKTSPTNPAFVAAIAEQILAATNNNGLAVKQSQSLNFPAIAPQTITPTATVSLNVTSSANQTPIIYSSGNTAVATISSNIVSLIGSGSTTITASQAGNNLYNPATASQSLIVSKASQTLNFPSIPTQTFSPFKTLTLNATSSAKLSPITYLCSNSAIGITSNNILQLQGTGTTTVTATQAGNAYFAPATATQTLIVK